MIASQQQEIEDIKIKIRQVRKQKREEAEAEEEEEEAKVQEEPNWPAQTQGVVVNMMAKFCHEHTVVPVAKYQD